MADNITVKDANGNDVVMRSTEQTLDEVTVVQVAHHIPEGEILETLQTVAYLLQDIASKLVYPTKILSASGEIPVSIGANRAGYVLPVSASGSLTSAGTISNITTVGNVTGFVVGQSYTLGLNDSERERIVIT